MITLTFLLMAALVVIILTIAVILVGGVSFIVIFGDIAVAVLVIWSLIKLLLGHK